jgi:hypothetical protein
VSVADVVTHRGINEVVHFTTNKGLVGILGRGQVLSRQRLPETKYVEHVYEPNADVRRDGPWLDYVNLSISRLNWEFFEHSRRWHIHRHVWWCALVFNPTILEGDGVTFATTNNIYSGCRRGSGFEALEALFAARVVRWAGNVVVRGSDMPDHWTTCHQAEVLVPGYVSAAHLRRIIVATDAHADIVHSQCEILLGDLPIDVDPLAFEPSAPR